MNTISRGRTVRSPLPWFLALGMVLTGSLAQGLLPASRTAPPRVAGALTFTKDVAPIVFEHCGICHHPGGSAPFSLLDPRTAKRHATQMALVTWSRYMPPWLPEPGYGAFVGARRLPEAALETIQRWVKEGAEEGSAADLPPIPAYNEGWQLGKPDIVVQSPRAYTLRAGGADLFRNFVFPIPLASTRYVKALEILPGNKKVVHHANALIDRYGTARQLDNQDAEIGFAGMKVKLESRRFEPQTHFLFWKPGTVPTPDPEDMTWPLDKGADLVLNMHLKPSGKPEQIQPSIGLYFSDKPPTKFPMLLQLEHDGALDIPPGAADFKVSDELVLPVDVDVLGVYPHAHYLGKEVQGVATLPSGEKRWLIWIKRWDLNWQAVYRYESPVFLPKGTTVSMVWTYDNSASNARNPNNPPRRVRAGNQSSDEMSHLWIQVLPPREGDRKVLQEALMRQKLRKYPRDFDAHYNLGAVLQSQGKLADALAYYRRALALKPGDATVENNVGSAILSSGLSATSLDEAIAHFRAALRARPGYIDARYNLGNALLAQGDLDGAMGEFRRILESNPADVDAHNRLGSALIMHGDLAAAASEFERVLRIDPRHASAHYNIGYVLARQGDLGRAAAHLEQSLRIKPGDASVHNELGSVYASQGKLTEAALEFERALQIDPGNPGARKGLQEARSRLRR